MKKEDQETLKKMIDKGRITIEFLHKNKRENTDISELLSEIKTHRGENNEKVRGNESIQK